MSNSVRVSMEEAPYLDQNLSTARKTRAIVKSCLCPERESLLHPLGIGIITLLEVVE